MVADSRLYRSIYEPTFDWSKNEGRIAQSLAAMQIFKLAQPIPGLLSLVRSYRGGTIKSKKLLEALTAIENFHFAFTAVTSSRSSGGISGMYSAFGRRLYAAETPQTATNEIDLLIEKLRDRRPPFDEFQVGFRQIAFTNANSKQKSLVRYILGKFAIHYKFKFGVDFVDLTVEHLTPQSLIDGEAWPSSIVGQLGNLALVDERTNLALGELPFGDKKRILEFEGCLPPLIDDHVGTWDAASVTNVTDEMAALAYESIWRL